MRRRDSQLVEVEVTEKGSGSSVAHALSEAQTIIDAARRRATEIDAEAQRVRQEASEAGYQDGYQRGLEDASKNAVRLIEESSVVAEQLADEGARLAVAIAKSVLGEEIRTSPEKIQQLARRALQESMVIESVIIRANPEDVSALEKIRPELSRIASGLPVSIEGDDQLTRGSCLVQTDFGVADASVSTLVDAVAERLRISLPKAHGKKNR